MPSKVIVIIGGKSIRKIADVILRQENRKEQVSYTLNCIITRIYSEQSTRRLECGTTNVTPQLLRTGAKSCCMLTVNSFVMNHP